MSLSLKLPEIMAGMFNENGIDIDYKKLSETANNIALQLQGLTVAEATLVLQEILRETYSQLAIGEINSGITEKGYEYKKPIDIKEPVYKPIDPMFM